MKIDFFPRVCYNADGSQFTSKTPNLEKSMKLPKRTMIHKIIAILLLLCTCLMTTSCFFDPDEAVNIKDYITDEVQVKKDSTVFYFYYESDEHPIEDYGLIKVNIDYYVDYTTSMKHKLYVFSVPDDIQHGEKPYFTAEIPHALTEDSHVYISVLANYKAEDKKAENIHFWKYILAIVIALALLIFLWSIYMACCEACYSNSLFSSMMWLGGLFIYIILSIIIAKNWGRGPGSIILSSAALYFFCTLFTYFQYKQ